MIIRSIAGNKMSKLLIVGGGYAGVWAAMSAAAEKHRRQDETVEISLLSRDGFLTMRPRLYEPLSDHIRTPLAPLMKEIGVDFRVMDVTSIAEKQKRVITADKQEFSYDRLVLATGSALSQPDLPGIELCFNVDDWEAASRLNKHYDILPEDASFVVIGASFAGIEIATELRNRFGEAVRIHLVDQNETAVHFMGQNALPYINEALTTARIEQHLGCGVEKITKKGVQLQGGEFIESETVILATGMRASSLTQSVHGEKDIYGRLKVDGSLKVIGSSDIYAGGDTSHAYADDDHVALMSCQHAIQLGRYVGHNAMSDLLGQDWILYRQEVYRTCLDLGKWGALFTVGWNPEVQATKDEGKAIKHQIVNSLIYPPSPEEGPDEIFRQISLIEEMKAAV